MMIGPSLLSETKSPIVPAALHKRGFAQRPCPLFPPHETDAGSNFVTNLVKAFLKNGVSRLERQRDRIKPWTRTMMQRAAATVSLPPLHALLSFCDVLPTTAAGLHLLPVVSAALLATMLLLCLAVLSAAL